MPHFSLSAIRLAIPYGDKYFWKSLHTKVNNVHLQLLANTTINNIHIYTLMYSWRHDGVVDGGSDWEVGGPSSNYIHLYANILEKGMNPLFLPPAMGKSRTDQVL